MLYIILAILVLMMLISVLFMRRERLNVAYNRMRNSDVATLSRLISDVCRRMRTEESGVGINPARLMPSIRRANAMIAAKNKIGAPLSESEKWFYENYYLVYRYAYSRNDNLKTLPHVSGVPRIVAIAKIIVNNSLESLTSERVKEICDGINTDITFTYAELKEFNNAISYAIAEQIYILAKRLLRQEFYKKAAYRKRFNENYLKSDTYVYYLYHINLLSPDEKIKLQKRGFNEKSALLNFNNVTVHNALMAKTLFVALGSVNEFMPVHIGLKYLSAYKTLAKATEIEKVSLNTRLAYFTELEKICDKTGIDEGYAAEKLVGMANAYSADISEVLFDNKRAFAKYLKTGKIGKPKNGAKILAQRVYSATVLLLPLIGAAFTAVFFDIAVGILSYIPMIFIAENILNYLLSHTAEEAETPKMGYKTVPYRHSVMVVVSEFIADIRQFKESMTHLAEINAGNGGENVQVVLLADLKGGNTAVSELDNEVKQFLESEKLDDGINVFIRKKQKINGKFQGKERKRGAINALNKLLVTGNTEEFYYIYNQNYSIPEYILTLDADNTLMPGAVTEMVNMMAHPYNAKYDLLSCHSRYNLYSLKSGYSVRFLAECGTEIYPTFSGLYYRLFRRDIYCGKGIYRLKSFYNKLEGIFPNQRILSHDVIEGSVLKTGGGGTVFEDAPTGFIADRERRKRWQRGDIQLLPFLGGNWKSEDGQSVKTDMEPVYKLIMGKNILGNLKELCVFTIIILGLFLNINALWFGLALFAAPYIVNEIKILRGIASGTLPRYILSKTVKNLLLMTEDFLMLSYYALCNATILVSTLLRMATGRKLLEWKTYYNSQNSRSLAAYSREFGIYFAIVTAFCIGMSFISFNAVYLGAYLLLAAGAYIELYITSSLPLNKADVTEREKNILLNYADKTYKYFKFMLSDGYIVADNFQVKPYKGMSKTTSPTNIGFSMLAEICAYNLKIISLDECCHNLNCILDDVKKLPKWHGNLYNWYDMSTLQPVNNFVSSVDSGNFCAAVMIVKEFFRENGDTVGELKAELTVANTDLNALFDRNKNLFYLGYDGEKSVGHYDLLNSESRILSTIYVARSGNAEHFRCLQRDYSSYRGNTLLSWSGTAFEALMPDLFFTPPKYSLLYKTAQNTVAAQKAERYRGVFGISESGCYKFDEELRYQYYAFGLNRLALRNEKTKALIAPYASALCINYAPKQVIDNLSAIDNMGGVREYGFYESIDCSSKPRFVASFMSHHQGMLLCAITNYLCDNELPRLLNNDLKIRAALNLYNELTPEVAFGLKNAEKQTKVAISGEEYSKTETKIEQYFQSAALTDTQYTVVLNSFGGGYSKNGNIYLTKFNGIYEEADGTFFMVKDRENWHSPTFLPMCKNPADFLVSYNPNEIIHSNVKHGLTQKTVLLNGLNGEVRQLSTGKKGAEIAFYSSVALNTLDGFRAHPAYNGLFTEAIADGNILILRKRGQKRNDSDYYIGVRVEGVTGLRFECNDRNFIGRNRSLKSAAILCGENGNAPSLGDVINPCVGFVGKLSGESCQVALTFGTDMKQLVEALEALPDDMYSYAYLTTSRYALRYKTNEILGEMLYLPYSQKLLNEVENSGRTRHFMEKTQGKKFIVYNFSETNTAGFSEFINLARDLNVLRVEAFYGVIVKNTAQQSLIDFIDSKMKLYLIKHYMILRDDDELIDFAFINLGSNLTFNRTKLFTGKLFELENKETNDESDTLECGSALYRSGSGGFDENDSYIVTEKTLLPYSNVICSANGGMLTTDNGGGYFFFGNSRENKASRFDNDSVTDRSSEYIYAVTPLGAHKICGGHGKNRFTVIEKGKTTHVCRQNGVTTALSYYMICGGRARVIAVDIVNASSGPLEIVYGFFPTLNWVYDPDFITFEQKNNLITVKNLKNGQTLYVNALVSDNKKISRMGERELTPYIEYFVEADSEKIYFVFTQDQSLALSLNANNVPVFEARELAEFKAVGNMEISSPLRSLNILARFLPYQIISSRLRGKLGFYQVGGATGFRDQLQDCMAFLHSDTELVRNQILYSARHQYEEGDVMHWWHHPNFGLRSKITDDKLFLPLVTAEYIEYSADKDILNVEIPYLSSPVLRSDELTRFENPPVTEKVETLLKHCLKAIKSALRYGEHGLLVMGCGDWNDGMDDIGENFRGESVFNSMLCYQVLIKFSRFCDKELKKELLRIAEELKTAVNNFTYEKDRYKRAFTDDGRWLGSAKSDCLTLDLLVQSYAVISGIADEKRAETVLNTAKKLIDHDAGIIKLLEPPLDKSHYLGYISAYPEGVRENGGQYTHASMWYLTALTRMGRQDEAFDLFMTLNPVEKCRDDAKNARYMGEPYVLSGDVYSNKDNYGRMGWSWYTGSAAWAYRLIVEEFYGLKRNGNKLIIAPRLPKKLHGSVITYNFSDSIYVLEYRIGESPSVTVNGEKSDKGEIILQSGKRERIVVEA